MDLEEIYKWSCHPLIFHCSIWDVNFEHDAINFFSQLSYKFKIFIVHMIPFVAINNLVPKYHPRLINLYILHIFTEPTRILTPKMPDTARSRKHM